jgi:hypothetical protein
MAKTIKSKVDYQVTELVNNLNEAVVSQSEQKRDFYTTRALYNAKRLSNIVSKAKIGAAAVVMGLMIASCGGASTSATTDSTAVDSTKVDSAVVAQDTTSVKADSAATK